MVQEAVIKTIPKNTGGSDQDHPQEKERQNDRILKEELPRLVGANMLLDISGEITAERRKGWNQSKNNTLLWM